MAVNVQREAVVTCSMGDDADEQTLCAQLYATLQDDSVLHYAHLLYTPVMARVRAQTSPPTPSRDERLPLLHELLQLFSYGTVRDMDTCLSPAARALMTPAMHEKLRMLSLVTFCAAHNVCGGGVVSYDALCDALQLRTRNSTDDDDDEEERKGTKNTSSDDDDSCSSNASADDDAVEAVVAYAVAEGVLQARLDHAGRCVRVFAVTVARDVHPRDAATLSQRLHTWLHACDEQLTEMDTAIQMCALSSS